MRLQWLKTSQRKRERAEVGIMTERERERENLRNGALRRPRFRLFLAPASCRTKEWNQNHAQRNTLTHAHAHKHAHTRPCTHVHALKQYMHTSAETEGRKCIDRTKEWHSQSHRNALTNTHTLTHKHARTYSHPYLQIQNSARWSMVPVAPGVVHNMTRYMAGRS